MSTSAIAGYNARVYISDDSNATNPEIAELTGIKLDIASQMEDATSHASAGWKENVPVLNSWKASFDALKISSDTAQTKLRNAILNKTKLNFRFDSDGTATGKERYSGSGFIDSWAFDGPTATLLKITGSITGTGALTEAAQ